MVLQVTGDDPVTVHADSVTSMDTSGVIRGSTPLGARPGAIAAGEGAVWVASPDEGRVSRLDLDSGAVTDTIPVGEDPTAIAVGEGFVWVANAAGPDVSRISPQTNDVVEEIETCAGPNAIAVGLGAVWVTCAFDTAAMRIDISTGSQEEIPLPGAPSGVAVGAGAVWMSISTSSTVVQLDPSTLGVVGQIEVGNGPEALVTSAGSIWVANRLDGTVDRLDPATLTRRATIDVGRDPSALVATGRYVWVAMAFDGQVLSIDTTANRIDREIDLGAAASSVAADGDRIWASAGAAAGDHRGGTLRTSFPFVETLDPGFNFSIGWEIISLTNNGLVGYRRVGGIGGTNLVPNLALSVPQPTDNGTTYRFQLRHGIRYSTGETVEPEDVRFALERVLGSTSDGKQFYGAIEGAERCSVGACDLSEGIVVDAAHNSVTFHLSRPDPDFLHKLSMPFSFPLPSTTPMKDQRLNPVPATGPYVVTASNRRTVELDRNPEFRPWNSPARPEGFPNRIIVKVIDDSEAAVSRVLDGSLDWTHSQPSPETIGRLLTQRPGQMHPTPAMANWQMYLNTARSPFDDVRVRQALNFAVDRDRIATIFGDSGSSTCQILFPNFPAYEPYCPFTLDPGPTWNGPDLERARDLIEEAGAAGIAVKVSGWTGLPAPTRRLVRYLVGLLFALELRASADLTKDAGDYFARVNQGETQMALLGFFPDWLAPEGVLSSQFACGGSNNLSFFCDPGIDDAMHRASAMQLKDLAAAADAWAAVEHRLVDDALILPLVVRLPTGLVSARTGNYQLHPQWGVLLDQLWVV